MKLASAFKGFLLESRDTRYSPTYILAVEGHIKHMNKFFGERELETLTLSDWNSYFQYMRYEYKPKRFNKDTSPLAGATLDNHWKTMRAFYSWAVDNNILSTEQRPDLKLKRPRFESPQVVPFTQDEIKRLLKASQSTKVVKSSGKTYWLRRRHADRDKAIIMVLLDTGVRLGELCRLQIGDLNMENGEIHIRPFLTSRKSRPRTVFLGDSAKSTLWVYLAKMEPKPDRSQSLFGLASAGVRIVLSRIGKNADVAKCHPHRFRHTFAINYLLNGGDGFSLQRLLGHSDLDMTKMYLNIAKFDIAEQHRKASPGDNWKLK
jgi:integrase/recombinase XerD